MGRRRTEKSRRDVKRVGGRSRKKGRRERKAEQVGRDRDGTWRQGGMMMEEGRIEASRARK